jgi:hypothetical protein
MPPNTTYDVHSNRYRSAETGRYISFKTEAKIQFRRDRILRAIQRANEGWLNSVGYLISSLAKGRIKRSTRKAPAGEPPHSRRGLLRRAIRYRVAPDRRSVVIGPRFSVVGSAGAAHEHGGKYKGETYPRRPFMGPTLDEVAPRIGPKYTVS